MPASTPKRTLYFISSHRRHKKIADRILGAIAADYRVELFSFDRGNVDHAIYHHEMVVHTSLGKINDGVSALRLASILRAVFIIKRTINRKIELPTVVLANTFETQLIAQICGLAKFPSIYDVADIHPNQLANTIIGKIIRQCEKRLLRRIQLLVVTSPWFYWKYYKDRLEFTGNAILVENQISNPLPIDRHKALNPPPTIAWNGLLRCKMSAEILLRVLQENTGIQLALFGTIDRLGKWGHLLIEQRNCHFNGKYETDEIPILLGDATFVWAIDFAEGENSNWLLPNRLYEAVAAGIPLIALTGTATGAVVRHFDIGIVLENCTSLGIAMAVNDCDRESYRRWTSNIKGLQSRSARDGEWAAVLEDTQSWPNLKTIGPDEDLSIVFGREENGSEALRHRIRGRT